MRTIPRPTRSGLKVLAVGLLGLAMLLVLYVASVGPACRIVQDYPAAGERVVVAYGPIFHVASEWDGACDGLLWYLDCWGVEVTQEIHGQGIVGPF
jgi:hypothetical protein